MVMSGYVIPKFNFNINAPLNIRPVVGWKNFFQYGKNFFNIVLDRAAFSFLVY